MRCAVSVPDLAHLAFALSAGTDIIEIRLDLTGDISEQTAHEVFSELPLPLIFTLRSKAEGGSYAGSPGKWWENLRPFLPYATYIDVEERFAQFAPRIREMGKTVISSLHTGTMPDPHALVSLEARLRSFGDIPKIVVAPRSEEDVLALLSFTNRAEKPIITSIMGTGFRYARLLLPLFGSYLVFCHCGTAASPGQYHVREWKEFCRLVRGH